MGACVGGNGVGMRGEWFLMLGEVFEAPYHESTLSKVWIKTLWESRVENKWIFCKDGVWIESWKMVKFSGILFIHNMLDIIPGCSTYYPHNSCFMSCFSSHLCPLTHSCLKASRHQAGLWLSRWCLSPQANALGAFELKGKELGHEEAGWVGVFLGVKSSPRKVNELCSHQPPQVTFSWSLGGACALPSSRFNSLLWQNDLFLIAE